MNSTDTIKAFNWPPADWDGSSEKEKGGKPPACAMNHWNLQGKQKSGLRGDGERGGRERERGWVIKEHNCEEKICFFHKCIIK